MRHRLRALCLAIGTLWVTGCHSMRFDVKEGPRAPSVEERNYYFLFALVPTRTIDVSGKCPNGVSAIYEETTFVDGVIDFFTLSLVSPRSTTYYCLTGQNGGAGQ